VAYVYVWTNSVNGKQYVGKGTGRRCYKHFEDAGTKSLLHAAGLKYGRGAFSLEIVADGLGDEAAYTLEMEEIARLGSLVPLGYNLTSGGEGLRRPSAATLSRMAEASRGNRRAAVPRSEETKVRMREAFKDRVLPEAARVAYKAAWEDPARRAEMSEKRRRPHTEETKAKMRKTHAGRPKSAAHIANQAAATKATNARKRAERDGKNN
jgi:group I intron endonuclease